MNNPCFHFHPIIGSDIPRFEDLPETALRHVLAISLQAMIRIARAVEPKMSAPRSVTTIVSLTPTVKAP